MYHTSMDTEVTEKIIRPPSFILLVIYKIIGGLTQVSLGLAFGIFGNQFLRVYEYFELSHLREDPNLFIRTVERAVPFLLDHRSYVIVFFLTFGAAQLVGAIGLWFEKLWAIYLMIILCALLLPFEIVDFLRRPTVFLGIYMVMNALIIIYLTHFNPHVRHIRHKHRLKALARKENERRQRQGY